MRRCIDEQFFMPSHVIVDCILDWTISFMCLIARFILEVNKHPIGLTISQLRTAIRIFAQSFLNRISCKFLTAAVPGEDEDAILQHQFPSFCRFGTSGHHVCWHPSP